MAVAVVQQVDIHRQRADRFDIHRQSIIDMTSMPTASADPAQLIWQLGAVMLATVAFYVFLNSNSLADAIYFIKWSTSYSGKYMPLPTKIDPVIADRIEELPPLTPEQKDQMINVTMKDPFYLWWKFGTWDACKNFNITALAAFLSIPIGMIKNLPGLSLKATLHGGGEEWCKYNQKVLETPFLKQISFLTLTIKPEFLRMPKMASRKALALVDQEQKLPEPESPKMTVSEFGDSEFETVLPAAA